MMIIVVKNIQEDHHHHHHHHHHHGKTSVYKLDTFDTLAITLNSGFVLPFFVLPTGMKLTFLSAELLLTLLLLL